MYVCECVCVCVCVCESVAVAFQHAKRMRRVTLPSVAFPALPNFSTLSHKQHDFCLKKFNGLEMCVLISKTFA